MQCESQSTQFQLERLNTLELTDRNLAWTNLLCNEEVAKSSLSLLDVYNIDWAKKRKFPNGRTFKLPMLAAAITSVDTSRFDDVWKSQLVDATAEVVCLLDRDLIDRVGGKNFKAGSVMLMKNVTVLK